MEQQTKKRRGFAAMTPEQRKAIAKLGGLAAQAMGVAHRFDSEEARAAGQKGGATIGADRRHMAEIGRRGGMKSAEMRRPRKAERQQQPAPEPAAAATAA